MSLTSIRSGRICEESPCAFRLIFTTRSTWCYPSSPSRKN